MARQLGFTVFLIDDDPSVVKSLARLLKAACFETKSFTSSREFLALHDPSEPGCIIADLMMPDIDGLQLQEILVAQDNHRRIIFLTGTGDIPASVKAIKAGAIDFLTKPVNRESLLAALNIARDIEQQSFVRREEERSINGRLATLTRREREILPYVVAGRLNKQIAVTIGTVEKTVKVHRMRMMSKLGLRCVADLVRLSERVGIAPIQDLR